MNTAVPSCGPQFSPQASWATVGAVAVQAALRRSFARWGRPERLRVDNGTPWGATGGLPTVLALWLAGLEVTLVRNPPRRPQANGVAERSQGVSAAWAEPQTCADATVLQQRLQEEDRIQREVYPSVDGRSRWQAYPDLYHSGRGYVELGEPYCWSLEQALAYLARYRVRRIVAKSGKVSLYDRGHMVGKEYSGQVVYVRLDSLQGEWVFCNGDHQELRRRPAAEMTQERIRALSIARQR
jgi:hypothetical protein